MRETYKLFIESIERPYKRLQAVREDLIDLRSKVEKAESAYTIAESGGLETRDLFTNWQALRIDLERLESKCKALESLQVPEEAGELARRLSEENIQQAETIQEQKSLVLKDIDIAYEEFNRQVERLHRLNEQQRDLAREVQEAQKHFKDVKPLKLGNLYTPIPTLPILPNNWKKQRV